MRYLFFCLVFSISVFSDTDLLDLYQRQGTGALEKVLDTQLASQSYWDKKIQHIDTRFGYLESTKHLLACDKNTTSLKLYTKDTNNSFILESDFSAFVGKAKGDKQREGDLKTPLGVYTLIKKLDHVDPFYGPLAFVTSYPNSYDKVRGKNGSGIWVHGLPLHQERDDYTRGCIAINNNNLEHLQDVIDFTKALVYIDTKPVQKLKKETLSLLLSQLFAWRKAWKENDIMTYLHFYDDGFKRSDGLDKAAFSDYKKRIFSQKRSKSIHFSDINILPYPTENKKMVFLITFYEKYTSGNYRFEGTKELYVHLNNKQFTILAEK